MGKWFPTIYDMGMRGLEERTFKRIRKSLLDNASGRVLEIGSGSGINFPLYSKAASVDAIEPSPYMIKKAEGRLKEASVPIICHMQRAEQLDFADNTFDAVVATLVFCTIPDPEKALKEIQRVAKPGARILFFEHVKMPQPALAKAQEVLTPAWKAVCDGCHLNRDTVNAIKKSGIRIEKVDSYYKGLFITAECTNEKIILH
jgi:ubiquinone/menaquinone biosynthesis C-methylase UbiE